MKIDQVGSEEVEVLVSDEDMEKLVIAFDMLRQLETDREFITKEDFNSLPFELQNQVKYAITAKDCLVSYMNIKGEENE